MPLSVLKGQKDLASNEVTGSLIQKDEPVLQLIFRSFLGKRVLQRLGGLLIDTSCGTGT